jgi:hypothetical protein
VQVQVQVQQQQKNYDMYDDDKLVTVSQSKNIASDTAPITATASAAGRGHAPDGDGHSGITNSTDVASSSMSLTSGSTPHLNSLKSPDWVGDRNRDEEGFLSPTTGHFPSMSGHISDEEEDVGFGPAKFSILAGLPAPKNAPAEYVDLPFFTTTTRTKNKDHKNNMPESSTTSLLSGLLNGTS